ncbi:MAG: hypothetical protein HQ513_13860 [Rhodospirillales bacterium]|nr:hypothetical protein [Rhodospirillales bacterium]
MLTIKARRRLPNRRRKAISLDITPQVAASRMLLQGYGDGGFRVAGKRLEGSHIIFPEQTTPWPVTSVDAITLESLGAVIGMSAETDILIVGCGVNFEPIPDDLKEGLKEHGIVLEWMDTSAACRTFNVLLVEERPVAAALIAV